MWLVLPVPETRQSHAAKLTIADAVSRCVHGVVAGAAYASRHGWNIYVGADTLKRIEDFARAELEKENGLD